ncbi:BlaI/MecI/CopY family transcriptional regulator [Alcanivorax profundi]|uniref:BlaI/MecI/CopY family transcriptional regulator n=1 Tax=Alcanivorax profundi TaxID=2338368 RepID=UPI0032B25B40
MQLGELEKQVLQYFWKGRTADAKSVHSHFEKRRGGTLNTIQSTLDRLYKKGLLCREKQGHAFHYQAAMDRQAFIGKLIEGIGEDYSADPGSTLIAAFSTFSEKLSDKQIEALEKLIEARREADAEQSDQ